MASNTISIPSAATRGKALNPSRTIRFFAKLLAVFGASVTAFFAEAQIPEGIEYTEKVYTRGREDRVYDFPEHATPTFEQTVEPLSDTASVVRVKIADEFPELNSSYPVGDIPAGMDAYLAHESHIQRDASEIVRTAEMIPGEGPYDDLFDLVMNVLDRNRRHLRYGNPSDIPDAVKAYNERVANCIGYVHLPAAILRRMGIPARTVRTFVARGTFVTRHYILEVYFPEDET